MIKQILYHWLGIHETCETCEVLKVQLELSNARETRLLNELMKENASYPPEMDMTEIQPIKPRVIPWHIKQAELERQDRLKAQAIKTELERKNDELEKELLPGVEFTPADRNAG